jgi:hypothetical protein
LLPGPITEQIKRFGFGASTKKISNVVIYSQSRAGKSYLRTPWRLRAGAQTGNGRISDHGQVQKSMEGAGLNYQQLTPDWRSKKRRRSRNSGKKQVNRAAILTVRTSPIDPTDRSQGPFLTPARVSSL